MAADNLDKEGCLANFKLTTHSEFDFVRVPLHQVQMEVSSEEKEDIKELENQEPLFKWKNKLLLEALNNPLKLIPLKAASLSEEAEELIN